MNKIFGVVGKEGAKAEADSPASEVIILPDENRNAAYSDYAYEIELGEDEEEIIIYKNKLLNRNTSTNL